MCNVNDLRTATQQAFKAEFQDRAPMPEGFAYKAFNPDTGLLAEYPELKRSSVGHIWENGMCNELGRLFQGYEPNGIVGTEPALGSIQARFLQDEQPHTYV